MTNWFTSDHHFNHYKNPVRNILTFCNRPYRNIEEMNAGLIQIWNSQVSVDDTVYHLGDFCFEGKKRDVIAWKEQLNGHIILVRGNHDHKYTRKAFKPDCYDELPLKIGRFNCMLAHRPLYPDYWDIPQRDLDNYFATQLRYEKYDFVISGHIHEARLWTAYSLNVGVDVHDYKLLPEDKVLSLLEEFDNRK